jgi:hypothetical protein
MNISIPRPYYFIVAFVIGFALYWPSMNGTPIWDDFTFWFLDPVMTNEVSYPVIWSQFGWPFSVSLQKFLFNLWGKAYFNYHVLNFCLHFANAFLVYKLSRYFRFRFSFLIFLIFLLHPVCVITTAWMIQFKTLLCFFFAFSSFLCFLKGRRDIRWMCLSWLLFGLSLASKSASLTMPLILLAMSFKTHQVKKLYLIIPFFLLSAWGSYRVLTSPVTIKGTTMAAASVKKIEPPKKEAPVVVLQKPRVEEKKADPIVPETKPVVNNLNPPKEMFQGLKFLHFDHELVAQTLYYYFWQPLLPQHNHPVKGLNYERVSLEDYVHLFFLVCLGFIFLKEVGILYLASFHFLMLPFLGFIPAPYMNVTWVSDQHLYLALPALIFFWMRMIEKIKWKYTITIPIVFICYLGAKTFETSKIYRNETVFFEQSLEYNPSNVPIICNLAMTYISTDKGFMAYNLLRSSYDLSKKDETMRRNTYYPQMLSFLFQMEKALQESE